MLSLSLFVPSLFLLLKFFKGKKDLFWLIASECSVHDCLAPCTLAEHHGSSMRKVPKWWTFFITWWTFFTAWWIGGRVLMSSYTLSSLLSENLYIKIE
jgi:hypothetical protein